MNTTYIELFAMVWLQRSNLRPKFRIAEKVGAVHHLNFQLLFQGKLKELQGLC